MGDELGVDLTGIMDSNGITNIANNATYNWQRFSADGTTLEADTIGWDDTYTTTNDDLRARRIKVQVYFTDDAGHSRGSPHQRRHPRHGATSPPPAPPTIAAANNVFRVPAELYVDLRDSWI